jgi:hypothetical protein
VILDAAMELAVGEGTGAAFAELDVGIGVEDRAQLLVPAAPEATAAPQRCRQRVRTSRARA